MLNGSWKNPLFVKGMTRDEDHMWTRTPEALARLTWSDLPYLCRIMTFCGIRSAGGGPVMFPKIDGNISLYWSKQVLSLGAGLELFLQQQHLKPADHDRVAATWNFLIDNNMLYQQYQHVPPVVQEIQVEEATFMHNVDEEQQPLHHGQEAFGGFVFQGEDDPGPRGGDVNLEDTVIAIDTETEELVMFTMQELMAMLFPELFPLRDGHFSLWHQRVKGCTMEQIAAAGGQLWSL